MLLLLAPTFSYIDIIYTENLYLLCMFFFSLSFSLFACINTMFQIKFQLSYLLISYTASFKKFLLFSDFFAFLFLILLETTSRRIDNKIKSVLFRSGMSFLFIRMHNSNYIFSVFNFRV